MGAAACERAVNSVIVVTFEKGVRKAKEQGDDSRGYYRPRLKDSFDLLLRPSRRAGVLLADHAWLFGFCRNAVEDDSTVSASQGRGTAILGHLFPELDSAGNVRGLSGFRDLPVSNRALAHAAPVQAILPDRCGSWLPGNSVWDGTWHFHVCGVEPAGSKTAVRRRAAAVGATGTAAESIGQNRRSRACAANEVEHCKSLTVACRTDCGQRRTGPAARLVRGDLPVSA